MSQNDVIYELEELANQPGTYFNPQTEVVVIVDDSTSLDQEVFNMEAYEGADWVRISEEAAVDEQSRDELLEQFQTRHHDRRGEPVSDAPPDPEDYVEGDGGATEPPDDREP